VTHIQPKNICAMRNQPMQRFGLFRGRAERADDFGLTQSTAGFRVIAEKQERFSKCYLPKKSGAPF
jgi:hypothetical protein